MHSRMCIVLRHEKLRCTPNSALSFQRYHSNTRVNFNLEHISEITRDHFFINRIKRFRKFLSCGFFSCCVRLILNLHFIVAIGQYAKAPTVGLWDFPGLLDSPITFQFFILSRNEITQLGLCYSESYGNMVYQRLWFQ